MKRDYYEVLGLNRDASSDEVKKAYRRMAIKYHPDKNAGDKQAEERFKEAAEAYSVLSDSQKRTQYDRFGHAGLGQPGQGFGGFDPDIFADFSDILGDFFGFGDVFGGRRRQSRRERGADLRYDLSVSFKEAAFGMKTKIKIPRLENCPECKGSGADPKEGTTTCTACGGRGQVQFQQGFFTIRQTCGQCRGSGKIVRKPCSHCHGSGRIQKERVLEIALPAGISDGNRLRISGEGEAGFNGGPPGDLYVVVSVEDDPVFQREGTNVICEVPISVAQAALGDEITVPTLEGSEKLRVPEGTQPGHTFRLKNRGIPSLNGRGRGDQFVKLKVVLPRKLTRQQRELFEQLAESLPKEEDPEATGFFGKVKDMFG